MDDKKLEYLLGVYKPEVRFLKNFHLQNENIGIGIFLGIGSGNTYHQTIQGDHFNNVTAYIAYNQFAIAFYSRFFEKRGYSLEELKSRFLQMSLIDFKTKYKRAIKKDEFQGEFINKRIFEIKKDLIIFKNEYSFDNAFFGEGTIAVDLR